VTTIPVYETAVAGTKEKHSSGASRGGYAMSGLKRAKKDRWLMGVCGGIAHRYGWNSTVVRLVTIVVAIIIPGVSVIPTLLVYFLLGYLLPETDEF
jgi:phage shock protein C